MSFRLIFELQPPRKPDLGPVHRQIEIFAPIVDAILVPDNHLGTPALSSVAIAVEIKREGLTPIVSLNARDRNLLRLESDLLTLAAYDIDEVLYLYGDNVKEGRTALTVREMLAATESWKLSRGVLAAPGKPLGWRVGADFLLTKLDFGRSEIGRWKRSLGMQKPLYCGVLALADVAIAQKILLNIPDLVLPPGYMEKLADDEGYGFKAAIQELTQLHRSGVDGAQLVIPAKRRRFAEMLKDWAAEGGRSNP
jgi:methylenetetrahydrofolate reductase (NADPH)